MNPPLDIARPSALLHRAFAPAGAPRAWARRLSARVSRLADLPRRSRWVCKALLADPRLRAGPLMGSTLGRILDGKRENAVVEKEHRRPRSPKMEARPERNSFAAWPAKRPAQPAAPGKPTPAGPTPARSAPAVQALPKMVPTVVLDRFRPASTQPIVERSRSLTAPWKYALNSARKPSPPIAALADWRQVLTARVERVLAKGARSEKHWPVEPSSSAYDGPWMDGLGGPMADLKLLSDLAYEGPVRRPGNRIIPEQAGAPSRLGAATPSSDRRARPASGPSLLADPTPAGGREDTARSPHPAGTPSHLWPSLDPHPISSARSPGLNPRDAAPVDPTDPLFTTAGIDLKPPTQLAPKIVGAPEERVVLPGPARAEQHPAEPGSAPSHAPRTGRLVSDNHELAKRLSRILRDEARRHGIDV